MASICSESLMDGLENYDVGETIGQGSHSEIKLSVCKRGRLKGRSIALKIIPRHFVTDEDAYRSTLELHRSLHHPAVLSLFSSFETSSAFYQVLEYCPLGSLDRYLSPPSPITTQSANRKLKPSQLRGVLRTIIEGLAYIHRNQIFHSDIQLSNILVTKDGRVKISGFHSSQEIGARPRPSPFAPIEGQDLHRQYFVAPEVLDGRSYGPAVDLWALGRICIVLSTGEYSQLARLAESLSHDLQSLINGLIKKNPRERTPLHDLLSYRFFKSGLPVDSLEVNRLISNVAKRDKPSRPPPPLFDHPYLATPPETSQVSSIDSPSHDISKIAESLSILQNRRAQDATALNPRSYSVPSTLPAVDNKDITSNKCSRPTLSPRIDSNGDSPPLLLCGGWLPPRTFRTKYGVIAIQPSGFILIDLREGERLRGRKGDTVLLVKRDGIEIEIYHALHLGLPCVLQEPEATVTFHELPHTLKPIYKFAAMYLDLVKRRIPWVVMNLERGKCNMMSNLPHPDIEILLVDALSGNRDGCLNFSTRLRLSRQHGSLEIAKYQQVQKKFSYDVEDRSTTRYGEWTKRLMPLRDDGTIDMLQIQDGEREGAILLESYVKICDAIESLAPFAGGGNVTASTIKPSSGILKNLSSKSPQALNSNLNHIDFPIQSKISFESKHLKPYINTDPPLSVPASKLAGFKPRLAGLGLPTRPHRFSLSHPRMPKTIVTDPLPRMSKKRNTVQWSSSVDKRDKQTQKQEPPISQINASGLPRYFEDIGWLLKRGSSNFEWLLLNGDHLVLDARLTVKIQSKEGRWRSYGRLDDAMSSPILSQAIKRGMEEVKQLI